MVKEQICTYTEAAISHAGHYGTQPGLVLSLCAFRNACTVHGEPFIYLFIIILYIIIYAICYYYYHYLILLFGSRWNNKVWRQSLVWVPVFSVTAVSLWILQSSPASTNFSFPFCFFFFLVFYFLVSCSYSVGFSSVSLLLQVTHSLRRSGRTNKIENTTGRRIAYYSQS